MEVPAGSDLCAEERERGDVRPLDFGRPGRAHRLRKVRADDPARRDDVERAGGRVIGSGVAVRRILGRPEGVVHVDTERQATGEPGVPLAGAGKDPVGRAHREDGTDDGRLFAERSVVVADLLGPLQADHARRDDTRADHVTEQRFPDGVERRAKGHADPTVALGADEVFRSR